MVESRSGLIARCLLAAILAWTGTTLALADVKAGVDAWSAGDYKAAIRHWQQPAESGDADAQFNLGQAYRLGRGVEQDLARAEHYFQQAAAAGHLQAADNYGLLLFQRGERARAMPYITAAAERGDPRAQYILGIAHFNGDTAPRDWVRAYALTSLAQQAGLPQATSALKQMDQHIPLEQRQQSVPLAAELRLRAETLRASLADARSLGSPVIAHAQPGRQAAPAPDGPATAGADYARPQTSHRPATADPMD
ncbi:MAG: sel1 repeat family protein, partial [Novosphingobium sp.]|nr:sel1 repeat family protein [Novosphingobium sp.]